MAIGINDLDDDDVIVLESDNNYYQPDNNNYQSDNNFSLESNNNNEDYISDYLKTKGIEDLSKIKFEDENNQIIERNWNDLSKLEKLNILNTPVLLEANHSNDLSDEEIQLLNTIRSKNMTPSQYIGLLVQQPVVLEPQYKIDDLSDDEIYLLDLESRVGEISDETAAELLANAKQNEEFYKKQVEGIRKEYKEREEFKFQQEQADIEQQQQEAYNVFLDSVINSIDNFNSIGNLDLNFDDNDKNILAEFMLSRDEGGNNYLWQALQDPDNLVKAAWFILNGEEALNNISDYFIKLIKLASESLYKKGFEEGQKGGKPSRPEIVINNNKQKSRPQLYDSIYSLDDDE